MMLATVSNNSPSNDTSDFVKVNVNLKMHLDDTEIVGEMDNCIGLGLIRLGRIELCTAIDGVAVGLSLDGVTTVPGVDVPTPVAFADAVTTAPKDREVN
jgi:hypothetical protein